MEICLSSQPSLIPSLYISSIGKSKIQTKAQTQRYQRYNREHISFVLAKSRVSTPALKCFRKNQRKTHSQVSCSLKINSSLDYIGANLIPCQTGNKKTKKASFLSGNARKQSKLQIRWQQNEKNIEKRERKARLLTQLVNNYKLNKVTSKINPKQNPIQASYNFPTQPYDLDLPKKNSRSKIRQFSLQYKEKSSSPSEKQEPKNAFTVDPEIQDIVEHQVSKIYKLKSQNNTKIKQFNLLNLYERSKYETKIKNIKITLKK